jgi:hypothetical protein
MWDDILMVLAYYLQILTFHRVDGEQDLMIRWVLLLANVVVDFLLRMEPAPRPAVGPMQ